MAKLILDIYHGERGIDLAEWKRRHGLWGVIVKCGGSDDECLNRYEETTWVEQVTQAHALGLHVGGFYYSDALNAEDALADAKHCVHECMRGMSIDMPLYIDIEERSQLNLPKARLTEIVKTWCDYVSAHGYQAGIYSGYEGFGKIDHSAIAGYSRWLACWQDSWPTWASDYDLWQEGSMSLDGQRYHKDYNVSGPGRIDLDWASDAFARRIEQGGGSVARKIDPANEAAEIHAFMCEDPRFGYSQDPRWGGDYNGGEVAAFTSASGHTYRIPCGSYDCSSSTTFAWRLALSNTKHASALDSATYTGDMRAAFVGSGLFSASLTNAKRGDLYLNEGVHVAMCQDGSPDHDILSEFNRNENHAAVGGRAGDQDGGESVIRGYYNDNWNTVLHYIGGMLDDVNDSSDPDLTIGGGDMVGLIHQTDSAGATHVYYWDGVGAPQHISPDQLAGISRFYKLTHDGAAIPVCKDMPQSEFEAICKL